MLRLLSLFIMALSFVAWVWSYYRPVGFGRIYHDQWVAESSGGSFVLARVQFDFIGFTSPKPVWGIFGNSCLIADIGPLAMATIHHHFLGLGFNVTRPIDAQSDKVWILDDSGTPVEVSRSSFSLPDFQTPPHRPWIFVFPWWFISSIAFGLTLFVWRRTKPKYAAFPITTI
jgi:hypothetical protein